MQEQQVRSAGGGDLQPDDIVFECPTCGKSLAIDPRGVGLVISCADCQTQVQVPELEGSDLSGEETQITEAPVDLAEQVRLLERFHAIDQERLQQISAEVGLIQSALDRVVALITDAQQTPQ